jgi:ribonuclease HI
VKNKTVNINQLKVHNHIIKILNNLSIISKPNDELWKIFFQPDTIEDNKLIKNNLSHFSLLQAKLAKHLAKWITLVINSIKNKNCIAFKTTILDAKIIYSEDIGTNLGKSGDRTIEQQNIAFKRYRQIKYNYQMVKIWTDGSVQENYPELCGSGIIIKFPQFYFTISIFSRGTINFAELIAINIAILFCDIIENTNPILLFTDSQFCFNNCFKNFNKNTLFPSFINHIQEKLFNNTLNIVKIPGHCKIPGNELADFHAKKSLNLQDPNEFNSFSELADQLKTHFYNFMYSNNFLDDIVIPTYFPNWLEISLINSKNLKIKTGVG